MSGHPDFDGPCQRMCPPPVFTEWHILIAVRATMQLTRRESTLGCKPRISRAASNAVTNFMRMSDATPPGSVASFDVRGSSGMIGAGSGGA